VAEKYESQWVLPDDVMSGGLPPFAHAVLEKAAGLSWTPRFFPAGAFQLDGEGKVRVGEVLTVARQSGVGKIVVGRVWRDASQPGNERVLASLEVLDAASGESKGEVGGELGLQGVEVDDAVVRLAASLLPALDGALSAGEEARGTETVPEAVPVLESWTLILHAAHPQSLWEAVRKEIEVLFKEAETTGFQMEGGRMTVQMDRVDGRTLRDALDGRWLSPDLPGIKVEEFSEAGRSMTLGIDGAGERR